MEKTLKKEYIKEVTRVISASFGFSSVSHNLRSSLFSISQRGSDPSLGDSSSLKIIPLPISFNFAPGLHRFGFSIFFSFPVIFDVTFSIHDWVSAFYWVLIPFFFVFDRFGELI